MKTFKALKKTSSRTGQQLLTGLLLQSLPFVVSATESGFAKSNGAVSFQQVASWIASLLLVLVIFLFCVWVIRKTQHLVGSATQQLKIVTGLALGMREKLVLIQVGDKQLLLGITPGRIEKLLVLEGDEQLNNETDSPQIASFSQKLAQAMKRNEG